MVEIATASTSNIAKILRQAKHKFSVNTLYNEVSAGAEAMSSRIANELVNEATDNYNDFIQITRLLKDAQYRGDTIITKEKYGNGYRVIATGSQVIYDEFGAGTEGEQSPHPEKYKYNLEGYNTGAFIKTNKSGNKYWTYYSDSRGAYVTSHGVPAGLFMYKSFTNVANNIASKIELDEMLKTAKRIAKRK